MFRRVRAGEPLDGALSAEAWNRLLPYAERPYVLNAQSRFLENYNQRRSFVNLVNKTNVDLPQEGVCCIEAPIMDPSISLVDFRTRPIWRGILPTNALAEKAVIIISPCKQNKITRAVIAGFTSCLIDVGDVAHTHAFVEVGNTTRLKSGFHGTFEIFWKETGTGLKRAYARFPAANDQFIFGTMNATIQPGQTNIATVLINGQATNATETVLLRYMHGNQLISSGKQIYAQWRQDMTAWVIVGAECES